MDWRVLVLVVVIILAICIAAKLLNPTQYSAGGVTGASQYAHPVIHISGASGAGKTTLGERLKAAYPAAKVFDADDISGPIIENMNAKRYDQRVRTEKYISKVEEAARELINRESQDAPVIIVGFMDWGTLHSVQTPRVRYDYKFFIDVSEYELLNQRWKRDVQDGFCARFCNKSMDIATKPSINISFEPEFIKIHNTTMRRQYMRQKYKFASADSIFADVSRILKRKA